MNNNDQEGPLLPDSDEEINQNFNSPAQQPLLQVNNDDSRYRSTLLDSRDKRYYSQLETGTPTYRAVFTVVSTMAGGECRTTFS